MGAIGALVASCAFPADEGLPFSQRWRLPSCFPAQGSSPLSLPPLVSPCASLTKVLLGLLRCAPVQALPPPVALQGRRTAGMATPWQVISLVLRVPCPLHRGTRPLPANGATGGGMACIPTP